MRVLVLTDVPRRVGAIRQRLSEAYPSLELDSGSLSRLRISLPLWTPDLLIADDPEHDDDRRALVSWLHEQYPRVPFIIILDAHQGEADTWLARGASEYVTRDHPGRLRSAVARVLETRRIESMLHEQNRIMEMIARGTPLLTVLDAIVAMVETSSPGILCAILLLSPDRQHLVHGSAPNLPAGFNQAMDGIAIGPDAGSSGTAAYGKCKVIVENIATDPRWEASRDLALQHGFRACWSDPIMDASREVLGTLALYAKTPSRPSVIHQRTMEAATNAVQIAVEQARAAQRIRTTTKGLSAVLAAADELLRCGDLETMYRRAVELGREKIGLERCALLLFDGDEVRGTFGTDERGMTTDERGFSARNEETWADEFDFSNENAPRWYTEEADFSYVKDGSEVVIVGRRGWVATTPVLGTNSRIYGLFRNDNAISDTPLDRSQQEVLSVYCSLLGTIIERRTSDDELRRSEERFARMAQTIDHVFWTANLDRSILHYVSPAFETLWGMEVDEVLADAGCWLARVHPDDRKIACEPYHRCEGKAYDIEYRLQLAGGRIRWIRDQGFPVFDDHGIPCGYSGMAEDITQRRLNENMERELEQKLARAKRMESLGVLAGGVAHDLNNILGPVVGYSDLLLLDHTEDGPLRDHLRSIRSSARRAADVIQDLLTLARRGVKLTSSVRVNEVIEAFWTSPVFRDLESRFPSVAVVRDLAPMDFAVRGTAHHLNQVIMNLVINGCEAMGEGGSLLVRTYATFIDKPIGKQGDVEEGDYVVLQVADTGAGMREKDLDHIFEPFYSKKAMGRSGTGLGLSVVYGIVQDADGTIDVKSKLGEGTVFTVYFPVSADPEATEEDSHDQGHGTETILVVDDVPEQRELARHILVKLGYDVHVTEHGRAAVEWLKTREADLVVLDMIMEEGFDGLDTYRRISDLSPGQRCIIASGFAETERVKEAESLGVGAYLRKPYTLAGLGRTVRDVLDRIEHPAFNIGHSTPT